MKNRIGPVAAGVAVILVIGGPVGTVSGDPVIPAPASPAPEGMPAGSEGVATVTLITGDQVVLSAQGAVQSVVPAAGREDTVQRIAATTARIKRVRVMPERRIIRGIPVAPPQRAVLDACYGQKALRSVRALLCEAVQKGLTTADAIASELGAGRWAGSRLVRAALADLVAGCRSAPECELRDVVRRSPVLAEPLWNNPLPELADGSLTPDACWPDARVVVEIDSAEWHRYGDRVEQTERRRAKYAALGWTVIPVSPRRPREEPTAVLTQIESAVQAGLARHSRAA